MSEEIFPKKLRNKGTQEFGKFKMVQNGSYIYK
jgi:hypothetical protein